MLRDQNGVIARRQVVAAGLTRNDIDRLLRRREWGRLLPGVYVDHTGVPTWVQRAWAGVLYYWPASLAGTSATGREHGDTEPIRTAVASGRNVGRRPGYRIRYLAKYDDQVLHHTHPPRMRFEEACLDGVLATASILDKIQLLAGACQSGRTTANRLTRALAGRARVSGRRFLESVLADIADGTCSVLEHGYLTNVERPHGLPRARRQAPSVDTTGQVYRDVAYESFDQLVELDGRLVHASPAGRDADLERDLDSALLRQGTVRLGWGQVFDRPCRTALKLGVLLALRGWTGTVRACGPDCEVAET